MGLDIYAYRVKKSVLDNNKLDEKSKPTDIYDALEKESKDELKNLFDKFLQNINDFPTDYSVFLETLSKHNHFSQYDWYITPYQKVTNKEELLKLMEGSIENEYPMEQAYFRKVNFIYAYFSKISPFDEELCVVTKNDIQEFINVCTKVILNHSIEFAQENLPTQAGFFFGSTTYDQWYWNDVQDCLNKMKILYNLLDDDDLVLWSFSW